MPKALNLQGQRFGFLTVLEKAESRGGKTYWKCRCDCGTEKIIQTGHLTSGATKSCGSSKCAYHLQTHNNNLNQNTNTKICEICGKEFIPNSVTRKYCFECSPMATTQQERNKSITVLRQAMKKRAVELRGGKCEKCGYNKSIYALAFHHRNPEEKSFGLSASGHTRNWQEYWQEVEKCDLLCANCHAEEHEKLDKQKEE